MKMTRLLWALLLVLFLFVLLIVSAPARLFGVVVPGDQLLMGGLTGTVWRGSAASVQLKLPQGYWNLGAVQWSLHPLSLLVFAPRVSVSSEWGDQRFAGDLVLRGQRDLGVFKFDGRIAADVLRHFAPVALDGVFNLQLTELQLRGGLPHVAEGRLVWQDGAWQSPRGLVPLGTYALDFAQAKGEVLRGKVITLSGPLQVEGGVELDGRQYSVDILMGSDEVLDPQLPDMLSLIAIPEDGDYRLVVSGAF